MISRWARTAAIALVATAAITRGVPPLSAADRLRAGEWEFTMTHAEGAPSTFKHCITADEAASINGDSKSAREYAEKKAAGQGQCKVNDYKVNGESASYSMTCGSRTIRATTKYRGDTSEGDLFTKKEGEPEIVSHVKARRIGNCP